MRQRVSLVVPMGAWRALNPRHPWGISRVMSLAAARGIKVADGLSDVKKPRIDERYPRAFALDVRQLEDVL